MEAAGPERPDLSPNLSPYSAADKICRYNNFSTLTLYFPSPIIRIGLRTVIHDISTI